MVLHLLFLLSHSFFLFLFHWHALVHYATTKIKVYQTAIISLKSNKALTLVFQVGRQVCIMWHYPTMWCFLNARWQDRPNNKPLKQRFMEWKWVQRLFLQLLCVSPPAAATAAAELSHFEHCFLKRAPLPWRKRYHLWTPDLGGTPSFFWTAGTEEKTRCATSGYTALGSPASLCSLDFKAR